MWALEGMLAGDAGSWNGSQFSLSKAFFLQRVEPGVLGYLGDMTSRRLLWALKSHSHWEVFSPTIARFHLPHSQGHSLASHTLQLRHIHSVPAPWPPAGFIDFIVEPTFSVLTDVAEKSVQPQADDDSKSKSQPR